LTTLINGSSAAAFHYLITHHDEDLADAFWEQVATGENIQRGDPTFALRQVLIKNKGAERKNRLPIHYIHAMLIKAWNAFIEGASIKVLKWSEKEQFPPLLYPRMSEFFHDRLEESEEK
jgi:hypothetical protein